MRFLANPWNIWTNGNLTLKKIVLRMAFKAPLSYSRESGFRTPQTSVIFRFLDEISLKSKMVPPRRIELLLPKGNWILNPARLPVPPQGHSDLN
jgi:hypothetical protein